MQYHGLRERESTAALRNGHSIFAAVTATKTGKTGQQQMVATETQKAQRSLDSRPASMERFFFKG